MRVDRVVAALLLAVVLSPACSPPAPDSRDAAPVAGDLEFAPAGLDRIREEIRGDIDAGTIAGAVVVLDHGGETVLFESFGDRDTEARDPMREDAIFRIFSMTKPVTAWTYQRFVSECFIMAI